MTDLTTSRFVPVCKLTKRFPGENLSMGLNTFSCLLYYIEIRNRQWWMTAGTDYFPLKIAWMMYRLLYVIFNLSCEQIFIHQDGANVWILTSLSLPLVVMIGLLAMEEIVWLTCLSPSSIITGVWMQEKYTSMRCFWRKADLHRLLWIDGDNANDELEVDS